MTDTYHFTLDAVARSVCSSLVPQGKLFDFFSLLLHWKWVEFSLQRRVLVALDFNQLTCSQSLKAYKTEMSRWAWGECATRFVKP